MLIQSLIQSVVDEKDVVRSFFIGFLCYVKLSDWWKNVFFY